MTTKQAVVKGDIVGRLVVNNIEGTIQNIQLTIDNDYTVKNVRVDNQEVPFTSTSDDIAVTNGFIPQATQLTIDYELQRKAGTASQADWFKPISTQTKIITKESVSHLSETEITALNTQLAKVNESITQSNQMIAVINAYKDSGATFGDLEPLPNVVTIQPHEKVINRTYQKDDTRTLFTDSKLLLSDMSRAVYNDMKGYIDFAGQVKALYGLDLYTDNSANATHPASGSLYAQLDLERLDDILVDLVTNTLTTDIKAQLVIPSEWATQVNALKTDITTLQTKIDGFKVLMTQVNTQVQKLVDETKKVQQTLSNKPLLVESDKHENTELVTVTKAMNADLAQLMQASRQLLDNTKQHQQVSETIRQAYHRLDEQVKALESQGTAYKNAVSEMTTVMEKEYAINSDFLKAFTQVMSNTTSGNVANTIVYDYLSHPIDGTLVDSRVTGNNSRYHMDNRTAVLMVLIIAVMTLAFVYMLHHSHWRVLETTRYLSATAQSRSLPLILLAGVGSLIGVMVSVVVSMKLNLPADQMFALIGSTLVIGISLIVMHNAFVKWLKAYGLLASLLCIVLYVISLGQLFDTYYGNVHPIVGYLTPLTFAETMLHTIINQQPTQWLAIVVMLVVGIVGFVCSLLYYQRDNEE